MAGDHGVVAEGVSAYPQEVTAQMVRNFLSGGAAVNVLAAHVGARVVVVDLGVASDLSGLAGPAGLPLASAAGATATASVRSRRPCLARFAIPHPSISDRRIAMTL